jgi:GNAT superfamily N-acetyltransferase
MTTTVRPVTQNDFAAWSALWKDYLAFYHTEKPPEMYQTSWSRIMDPTEKMYALLAEVDGKPIGLANYLFHRSFWEETDKCYLNDLYVRPEARGNGAGRALIEAVAAASDAAHCSQLWWFTAETNTTARQLYDRLATKSEFVEYVR